MKTLVYFFMEGPHPTVPSVNPTIYPTMYPIIL